MKFSGLFFIAFRKVVGLELTAIAASFTESHNLTMFPSKSNCAIFFKTLGCGTYTLRGGLSFLGGFSFLGFGCGAVFVHWTSVKARAWAGGNCV